MADDQFHLLRTIAELDERLRNCVVDNLDNAAATSFLYFTSARSGSIPVVSQSIMKPMVPVGASTVVCALRKPARSPACRHRSSIPRRPDIDLRERVCYRCRSRLCRAQDHIQERFFVRFVSGARPTASAILALVKYAWPHITAVMAPAQSPAIRTITSAGLATQPRCTTNVDGIPYDSAEADWAGAITAVMCGQAYLTSARIAEAVGPCAGYEANEESFLDVILMHGKA